MAKLKILNKKKIKINEIGYSLKSFECNINSLCNLVSEFNDILYHTGNNPLPIEGNYIFIKDSLTNDYIRFTNNSAALKPPSISFSTQRSITYIKTNNKGQCIIQNCN